MSFKASYSHSEGVPTRWATVLLQPLPGSGEQVVVAVAAVSDDGERRCLRTIDPANVKTVFRDEHQYVSNLISFVTDSLDAHLAHARSLDDWVPPVEGVALGARQQGKAVDIDDFVRGAASLSTIFYRDQLQPQAMVAKRQRWMDVVSVILAKRNKRLCAHLDVRVPLGGHDAPATFSFLDSGFAANLVTFSQGNLRARVEDARAGLWSLSLLADAPYIFRPERKELLAGTDVEPDAQVREAVEEIVDEAARRSVLVTQLATPEAVASHILEHASAG